MNGSPPSSSHLGLSILMAYWLPALTPRTDISILGCEHFRGREELAQGAVERFRGRTRVDASGAIVSVSLTSLGRSAIARFFLADNLLASVGVIQLVGKVSLGRSVEERHG